MINKGRFLLLSLAILVFTFGGFAQSKQPKTVRDYFNLLTQKYYPIDGCEPKKDKDCKKARAEWLKTAQITEDTKNAYLSVGCDGGQSCLDMTLFKRPNLTYVVAVRTGNEADEVNHFLEYKNGKWHDISSKVVPQFSRQNAYQLPRTGTTIEVFKKKYDGVFSERTEKIYDLEWKNGKFAVKK